MKKTYDDGVTVYDYGETPKEFLENYYQTQKLRFFKWLNDAKEYAEKDNWVMALMSLGWCVNYGGNSQSLVEYARPTKETGTNKPIPDDQEHR